MLSPAAFSDLLRDLSTLDKPLRSEVTSPELGRVILEAFVRHAGAEGGALYLAAGEEFQLLVSHGAADMPPAVSREAIAFPANGHPTFIPIELARGEEALLALDRSITAEESRLLRAATDYARAIVERRRMESEIREGDFQLKYRLWELESLYDIGLSIASTLNLDDLADQILVRTISLLNARSAALFLKSGERFTLHRSFGDVRSHFFDEEIDQEQVEGVIMRGATLSFDRDADCIFPGCESFIAMPIRGDRGVIGVLAAADREQRDGGVGAFEQNDIRLLSQFATQAAIALENARLHREALEKQAMERELEVAATIQRDILPRSIPVHDGLEVGSLARPARQVGGDYHSYFTRDDHFSICVADVSGKSVPAAILVSALHAALQLLFDQQSDLGFIATELNRHIHRWSAENKFVTLVLATIDRAAGKVRYVNAGHNPGYVVANGESHALNSHGLPIGLLSGSRYTMQEAPFPPGALLALYSDGISEAENAVDEEFGTDRLQEILLRDATASCESITADIAKAVDGFTGDLPQKDDQTLVIVRSLL